MKSEQFKGIEAVAVDQSNHQHGRLVIARV